MWHLNKIPNSTCDCIKFFNFTMIREYQIIQGHHNAVTSSANNFSGFILILRVQLKLFEEEEEKKNRLKWNKIPAFEFANQ